MFHKLVLAGFYQPASRSDDGATLQKAIDFAPQSTERLARRVQESRESNKIPHQVSDLV
jgi:hypothetical protein